MKVCSAAEIKSSGDACVSADFRLVLECVSDDGLKYPTALGLRERGLERRIRGCRRGTTRGGADRDGSVAPSCRPGEAPGLSVGASCSGLLVDVPSSSGRD